MITRYWPDKDPAEVATYDITWILPTGDTINGVGTWTEEEGDGALIIGASTTDGDKSLLQVSAGTAGIRYKLNCHIATALGNQFDRAVYIRVRSL